MYICYYKHVCLVKIIGYFLSNLDDNTISSQPSHLGGICVMVVQCQHYAAAQDRVCPTTFQPCCLYVVYTEQ